MSTVLQIALLDESGDSYHRMRWPARQLADQDPSLRVINLDFRSKLRFDWGLEADLLVILHCADLDLLPLMENRRSLGKKTLVEINDNFYSPQAWNPARRYWESPQIWKAYESFMAVSDGVIVTGPGLSELLETKTSVPIHILENHCPFKLSSSKTANVNLTDSVVFGWAGSAGHMADLLFILPELRYLLSTFPHLKIHIMGDVSTPTFLSLPPDRCKFIPFGPVQNYFEFWDEVDLAFVPLIDTSYNRCRSDIKAVEIAAKGVLPILQQGLPYEKFISKTECPHFKTLSEFRNTAAELIQNPEQRRKLAEQVFHYVKAERQGSQRRERLELYSSVLKNSPVSSFKWPLPTGVHEVSQDLDMQTKWPSPQKNENGVAESKYQNARAMFFKENLASAREGFHWLLDQREILDENKKTFDEIPEYVFEIWAAALEARIQCR